MLRINKRSQMKRIVVIAFSLILLLIIFYKLYFLALPSVEIFNKSDKTIVVAEFYLPESRIVTDNVLPNEKSKIYYDLKQENGVLSFLIKLSDSTKIEGNCGQIKNNDFGKRIRIEIDEGYKITCNQ